MLNYFIFSGTLVFRSLSICEDRRKYLPLEVTKKIKKGESLPNKKSLFYKVIREIDTEDVVLYNTGKYALNISNQMVPKVFLLSKLQ